MNGRISIALLGLVLGVTNVAAAQDLTIANVRIIAANGSAIERGSIVVRAGSIVRGPEAGGDGCQVHG